MSLAKQVGYRRTSEPRQRMNAAQYKSYLEKGLCEGMEIHYENCGPNWDTDFMLTAQVFGKLNNSVAIEYIESWNPEESQQVGYKKLFEAGIDNAKKAFPMHSFIVVPQVNKNGNFHNHVLFCTVNDEGKRIYSDFKNRYIWHTVCDKKSKEMGLSTVSRLDSTQKVRMSDKSHRVHRRGLVPYQLQVIQRADFARRIATNLNEFITLMGNLSIRVHDRGKVLTYFHPTSKKGSRDRKLGLNYGKEELNK